MFKFGVYNEKYEEERKSYNGVFLYVGEPFRWLKSFIRKSLSFREASNSVGLTLVKLGVKVLAFTALR